MKGYTLIREESLPAIGARGYLYRHDKSGAYVCYLSNPEDDNKVFCISFRTPPEDDCGTPHIIEHTVLCGSEKYPLKDPFMQLEKGSMNTFLNAMTGAEMTMYPIASQNDKDFKTLMDVYLDAVFHPYILKSAYPFMQEGWHYVPDAEADTAQIQGVVFNEMKGARSDPEDEMTDRVFAHLFPDNAYRFNAGGVPEHIPELTYEAYLDYYRRHYQPSNSIIYLYGDGNQEELLSYLDTAYLGQMEDSGKIYEVESAGTFTEPCHVVEPYAAADDEDPVYFCYSVAHGTWKDNLYTNCLSLLGYLLIEEDGAPLREALIRQNIGDDVYSIIDPDVNKPVFSIVVKNADPEKEQLFYDTIRKVCSEIAETGFPEDQLEGALNRLEFRMREGNQSSLPTGLVYLSSILNGLKKGEDPFAALKTDEVLSSMRQAVQRGYLQDLIREIFLEETHVVQYVMQPDAELAEKREQDEQERCHKAWSEMTDAQKEALTAQRAGLLAYQAEGESQEALESIPMLRLSDIDPHTERYPYQVSQIHEVQTQIVHAATNGIAYIQLLFPLDKVTVEELPYTGMLLELLGSLDTTRHTYVQLTHEVDKTTGGIWMSADTYHETEQGCDPYYAVSMKCLYAKLDQTLDLAMEQILDTVFDDKERIRDVLKEMLAIRESRLNGDGDDIAVTSSLARFSYAQAFRNQISSLTFTDKLRALVQDFDAQIDQTIEIWKQLIPVIFVRDGMLVHITSEEKESLRIRGALSYCLQRLPESSTRTERAALPALETGTIGWMTPAMVQYVSLAVRFPQEYSGKMQVMRSILSSEYLWRQIRELGGAYGCRMILSRYQFLAITSFRDPHLQRTKEVYRQAEEFLKNFTMEPRQFDKYIIGTINRLTQPLSVAAKSRTVLRMWLDGISDDDRQRTRTEILTTTQEDIRAMADVLHTLAEEGVCCVVGNAAKIREHQNEFDTIRTITQGVI